MEPVVQQVIRLAGGITRRVSGFELRVRTPKASNGGAHTTRTAMGLLVLGGSVGTESCGTSAEDERPVTRFLWLTVVFFS